MNAVQVETDPHNTHMLLGGLLLCVQDAALFEENENPAETYQTSPVPSDINLLSSGNQNIFFYLKFFAFRIFLKILHLFIF